MSRHGGFGGGGHSTIAGGSGGDGGGGAGGGGHSTTGGGGGGWHGFSHSAHIVHGTMSFATTDEVALALVTVENTSKRMNKEGRKKGMELAMIFKLGTVNLLRAREKAIEVELEYSGANTAENYLRVRFGCL